MGETLSAHKSRIRLRTSSPDRVSNVVPVHINLSHEQNSIDCLLCRLFRIPSTASAVSYTEIKCLLNRKVTFWINLLAGHFSCIRDTWTMRITCR